MNLELFLEYKHLVPDKVPNQTESRRYDLGRVQPEFLGQAEHWVNVGANNSNRCRVDYCSNDADNQKQSEFLALFFACAVFECPGFVQKVAVDHSHGKGNDIKRNYAVAFINAGRPRQQI